MSFLKNMTWSPSDYAKSAVIAHEAGVEMISRLEWLTLKPQVILDVGAGTGEIARALQKYYPDAKVWAVDLSPDMISYLKRDPTLSCLQADSSHLPFSDHSVDIISGNFLLPWVSDLTALLREWRRVLKPDGLLMFTTLGPDTCREWQDIVPDDYLPKRLDMHDVGDLLLAQGFADPVLDVNHFNVVYKQKNRLIEEVYASGMLFDRSQDLLQDVAPNPDGTWSLTYEVVYGHAFGAQIKENKPVDGVTKIPLSSLREQIKNKNQ